MLDDPQARQTVDGWSAKPSSILMPAPKSLPVTRWLNEAERNAPHSTAVVVQALAEAKGDLRWQQTYSVDDLGQSFLDRYGWTLLVGPEAPVSSNSTLAGFLLLGPDTEYPVHQHSAEEIYVILSGEASWKIGNRDWQNKSADGFVHNPPWQPHGIRTDHGQPLLLGFMWKAGAVEKSKIVSRSHTQDIN